MCIDNEFLQMLRCPVSGESLHQESQREVISETGKTKYRLTESGIPLFAEKSCSQDARRQQAHYDRVSRQYVTNLMYPHTQEYSKYLDRGFLKLSENAVLDTVAEICCGSGETFKLLDHRVKKGIGVDISLSMIEAARENLPQKNYFFLQGDATILPLKDEQFDSVFLMGGIHHVNNRELLFSEIYRILKNGGQLYWREPADDFWLWRWIRSAVYRISSSLDEQTERPLRLEETTQQLHSAGLRLTSWQTYGFGGYCLLMNSDVLVFNRFLRYLPGIVQFTRFMTRFDDRILRVPKFSRLGLIVLGSAEKNRSL